jgi:hypothetical protein
VYNIAEMATHELIRRALAAYGWSDGEPLPTATAIQKIGGLRYVLLHRSKALLAVYRVRNDGKLKRLKRLPDGI